MYEITDLERIEQANAWFHRAEVENHAQSRPFSRTCPQCGTDFGMHRLYLEDLLVCPPHPTERFYRAVDEPEDCHWVWQTCYVCNAGAVVDPDFHELDLETVDRMIGEFEEGSMAEYVTDWTAERILLEAYRLGRDLEARAGGRITNPANCDAVL
jgi:hypothetical protein